LGAGSGSLGLAFRFGGILLVASGNGAQRQRDPFITDQARHRPFGALP
jgi:hypothetical protein